MGIGVLEVLREFGGLTRSCADGEGLRGVYGWVEEGKAFGRFACGLDPAFGRAEKGFLICLIYLGRCPRLRWGAPLALGRCGKNGCSKQKLRLHLGTTNCWE